jgi:hypothetical protein
VLHTCYLIVQSWIAKEWLPGTFYLHALALFALALLPGYLLIYLCVARQLNKRGSLETMLGVVKNLPACGPAQALVLIHADLDAILSSLRLLRARALSVRTAINNEFGGSILGAAKVDAVELPNPKVQA